MGFASTSQTLEKSFLRIVETKASETIAQWCSECTLIFIYLDRSKVDDTSRAPFSQIERRDIFVGWGDDGLFETVARNGRRCHWSGRWRSQRKDWRVLVARVSRLKGRWWSWRRKLWDDTMVRGCVRIEWRGEELKQRFLNVFKK